MTHNMDNKKLTTASSSTDREKTTKSSTSYKGVNPSARPPANITTRRRIVQNFLLIWLDANIDESTEDCQNSITQLRCIVNTINTFTDADQCVDFLTEIKQEKAFMIVPGYVGQRIIPRIHDMSQLDSIYVFCGNKSRHEQWAKEWPKVKGVFTQIGPICHSLQEAARQCDQDCISISFLSTSEASNQNLDELDQSFMYTHLFKEILLEIDDYDAPSIKELADYCRESYLDNQNGLEKIAKFEREYSLQTPIWWYTYECFLYSMLNRALRNLEVDTILKMGFFIRDLHRQIEQLHSEQSSDHQESFTVYRGQGLSKTNFEKLMQTQRGLMSFNNFLSTSKDREVSFAFADSNRSNRDLIGILFQITIDGSISSPPFAFLDHDVSNFSSEQEILFSMHTVFRIGEIKKLDDNSRLWQVNLRLTSDSDPQLGLLTKLMREETEGTTGWSRLGNLLIKVGEFGKAEQIYEVLLNQTSEDDKKADFYYQLGWIKDDQGEYQEALSFYEKALEIRQKTLPSNHCYLAESYSNIGLVYDNMGEYSKALSFYEKALEIDQNTFPPNNLDLASSYNNVGVVYDKMGEYSKALSSHEKALDIREKALPSNHPTLAISYSTIALVYDHMGEYSKALSSYEKALHIREKALPPNHPAMGTSYNNIGAVYMNMGEYSKALSFHEKSLEINQKTFSPNHPNFATSYNNIGLMYDNMGEYSKALSFYEKAVDIREKALPPNHPMIAQSYNNIGVVYDKMGEYSKALSFHEKALEILQRILPPNHPSLASSYKNFGMVYHNMGEHSKALLFHEKAVEIRQKALSPNHPDLAQSYNNVGLVYKEMGEYSKALSFHEKALEIYQKTLPPNHPHLRVVEGTLESVRKKM